LSSYQIDLMPSLKPSIGMLLNVSPDHLDRHGGFDSYAAIKARVPAAAEQAIIGCDDETTRAISDGASAGDGRLITISGGRIANGYGVQDGIVRSWSAANDTDEMIANINGVVSLRGTHNAQNAAAAAAACQALGLSASEIAAGLQSFPGLPHRMEELGRRGSAIFVNDSKATNAESTANALAAFTKNIHWIAGGLAKDGGIAGLSPYFPRITKAYLIGAAAKDFAQTLNGHCPYQLCETLDVATANAASDAAAARADEPIVLLSPACASFDQFRSFEVRGERFREFVSQLPGIVLREAGK